jgi:hypothetical protein
LLELGHLLLDALLELSHLPLDALLKLGHLPLDALLKLRHLPLDALLNLGYLSLDALLELGQPFVCPPLGFDQFTHQVWQLQQLIGEHNAPHFGQPLRLLTQNA